jgi:hypothetical protein
VSHHSRPAPSSSCPFDDSTDIYAKAFHHWKGVRSQLAHIIGLYVETCIALDAVCALPLLHASSHHSLQEKFSELALELPILASDELKLQRARSILTRIRNRSSALTPINALPSEILVSIFSMASDDCLRNCFSLVYSASVPKTPALASVCTLWRELYQNFHTTSSHLDLIVSGSSSDACYHYADVLASRSFDRPIHLNIRECEFKQTNIPSTAEISRLVGFLTPLMPRVYALEIKFRTGSQLLIDSIVACWVKHGSSNMARIFKVWSSESASALQLGAFTELGPDERVSSDDFEEFFRPVRTLVLDDCYVPWISDIYKGLEKLCLGMLSERDQTQSDIAGVLDACPRLRWLVVDDLKILEQESTPDPVHLNHLEFLSISQHKVTASLKFILPLLITGSNSATVTIRLCKNPDFVSEARSFFTRSAVARLFVYGSDRYEYSLVSLLCPAPDLQELVIRDCAFRPYTSQEMLPGDEATKNMDLWPLLHTVYLIGCTLDRDFLREFITLHPVRKLWFYRCYLMEEEERRHMTSQETNELKEFLSRDGVEVKYFKDEIGCPTRLNFFDKSYA